EIIPEADIVVTATGNMGVVTHDMVLRMKDHAILCNIGHFDTEIETKALREYEWTNVKPQVDLVHLPNGRVVILRASGADDLQERLYRDIGGTASVQTLVFDSRRAADDPAVLRVVAAADAIFIAGGDQSRYIRFWKGTALNAALNAHVRAGRPIAGTSAGLAILGGYSYGALDGGSVTSERALRDPMGSAVTLDNDFLTLPYLSNVVTDTHFGKRDRLGRLIVFVARAAQEAGRDDMVGIGVDEDTALCVEADGRGRVLSKDDGYAWLVMPRHTAERLREGEPLDFHAIAVTGVGSGSLLHLDGFGVDDAAFRVTADIRDGHLQLR
ncbi:MAG: Type 1 glutamine amidotransferase-like domain-containing protein, partial [Stenotrophomonas sp.]